MSGRLEALVEPTAPWDGYLTVENLPLVVDRLHALLDGKRYTWVSLHEMSQWRPEIRPSQRLHDISVHTPEHFSCHDDYGIWGCHTFLQSGRPNRDDPREVKNAVCITFAWDRVKIDQFAPAGYQIQWNAVIEHPLTWDE